MENKEIAIKDVLNYCKNVPTEKWIKGSTCNEDGECCFLGHVATMQGKRVRNTGHVLTIPEIDNLDRKISKYVRDKHNIPQIVHSYQINDSSDFNGYTEETPKERIIHLLEDMVTDGID